MTRTAQTHIAAATAAYEAGFTSKAQQKAATDELNRAYSRIRDAAHDAICAAAPHNDKARSLTVAEWAERGAYFQQFDAPFDLHNVRERHLPLFKDDAATVEQLLSLRGAIKAAPVVKVERPAAEAKAVKVRESIMDLMKRRGEQYNRALDLGGIFDGRLPVTANVHLCVNEHGTEYVRAFYYLMGEFTPLNVIIAAHEELVRRSA